MPWRFSDAGQRHAQLQRSNTASEKPAQKATFCAVALLEFQCLMLAYSDSSPGDSAHRFGFSFFGSGLAVITKG